MSIEIVKILVERILNWPVAVLVGLLIFKSQLSALLGRVSSVKAGKEGFSLDAAISASVLQTETTVEVGLTPEAEKRLKEVQSFVVPSVMQEREALIMADLQRMNLAKSVDAIPILVRHLAAVQLVAAAEQVYRTIFGSQIAVLRYMNSSGCCNVQQIANVYEEAKRRFPALYENYSLEQYIGYLTTQQFLVSKDGQYCIAELGREFLKWMVSVGATENKPF